MAAARNDVIDAAVAAAVAALHGDDTRVTAEDYTTVCALLEERRANVAAQRVRLVNQLHAELRDLLAGGMPTALSADSAATVVRSFRPVAAVEHARKAIARELIAEIRAADDRLDALAAQMTQVLEEQASALPTINGVGPVLAVRLIGRTGRAGRFRSAAAFAS